jgi:hypothetical protein
MKTETFTHKGVEFTIETVDMKDYVQFTIVCDLFKFRAIARSLITLRSHLSELRQVINNYITKQEEIYLAASNAVKEIFMSYDNINCNNKDSVKFNSVEEAIEYLASM